MGMMNSTTASNSPDSPWCLGAGGAGRAIKGVNTQIRSLFMSGGKSDAGVSR